VTRHDLETATKAELMVMAQDIALPGRSRMTKGELIDALLAADAPDEDRGAVAGGAAALGDLGDDDFDISFREIDSGRPVDAPASRGSGRARRAALNDRFAAYFDPSRRCASTSLEGHTCGLPVVAGDTGCVLHGSHDIFDVILPIGGHLGFDTWPALLRQLWLAGYETDPIGLDPVVAEITWYLVNFLYFDYFRVEVEGVEHLPAAGGGMLVANHGGAALPYDGLMLTAAVANEGAVPRRLRVTATELFNIVPFLAPWFRKAGGIYAAREDVTYALRAGHLVGVFPEGEKGFMKPVWDAYEVQRFGRGGFVSIAEDTGVPIVPVAIVGSEEVHPAVTVSTRLAKLVQLVMPEQRVEQIAVFLNPIPLPIKWKIRFHPPVMPSHPGEPSDPLEMLERAEQIRATIQASLDAMLEERDRRF
jgi:1-acyl-sn-glycerol-3-phosphate acyltransferase